MPFLFLLTGKSTLSMFSAHSLCLLVDLGTSLSGAHGAVLSVSRDL
jgi:hypothetical protein